MNILVDTENDRKNSSKSKVILQSHKKEDLPQNILPAQTDPPVNTLELQNALDDTVEENVYVYFYLQKWQKSSMILFF